MKNVLIAIFFLLLSPALFSQSQPADYTALVNPFIGTQLHGHTYPGATVPFGMVQLSPDNGSHGWDWSSGYNYSDSIIAGFSHTHLSGTGVGDLGDIQLMPSVGIYNIPVSLPSPKTNIRSRFSHSRESATPGFYSVFLERYNIDVELTATTRCGFHKYVFSKSDQAAITLDLGYSINYDRPVKCQINIINDHYITGYRFSTGWAQNQKVFFAIEFSKPFTSYALGTDSAFFSGVNTILGDTAVGVFQFKTTDENTIYTKVGISYVDIAGAEANLKAEIPDWDFQKTRTQAHDMWEKELSKVNAQSKDVATLETFYTAIYHSLLAPVTFFDADRRYRGGDDQIHSCKTFDNYSIFSLWDTFRAEHPMFTLFFPERVPSMVESMLAFDREFGALPIWSLVANETYCMIGYHSVPPIVDAMMKGLTGFDYNEAFAAMKKAATLQTRGLDSYQQLGYVAADKEGESVSKTLEYAYDDWCIAQAAKLLGRNDDYALFSKRAMGYKNLFDPRVGLMRGKNYDGSWVEKFDALHLAFRSNEYTEGNSWQYSWFVPHDIDGFVALFGSKEKFNEKLDSLFTMKVVVPEKNLVPDISGLIGQYAHGNEPSHHIVYMFNYTGKPWRTQELTNYILTNLYSNKPDGLCGNEDCGQMSAWYILSAMGIYQLNPAGGNYTFGSPVLDKVSFKTDKGNLFEIEAQNLSPKNKYIQEVTLNGKQILDYTITHEQIRSGGKLVFVMGSTPKL